MTKRLNGRMGDPAADGERAAREDNRKARMELRGAQGAAASKIATLMKTLGEYQDAFERDLHPTWPQIGSANLICTSLEDAVRHINSMSKGVRS